MTKTNMLWLILLMWAPSASALDGTEILRKSDEKLIPEVCSYALSLDTTSKAGKEKSNEFKGYKKGKDKNVLVVRTPKKVAGSVHLRKEDVIWSYFTTNHQLTKVAYQAIFMGTLLNYGDVLATELSTDYDVKDTREDGKKYTLTLTPKKGHTGYGKIEVIINKESLLPEKRSYYSLSNILLKECTFKEIKFADNVLSRMVMEFNEPLKERKTLVTFQEVKKMSDFPDKYFNENQIKFLGGE